MTPSSTDAKERLLAETRGVPSATRGVARVRAWLVLPASAIVAAALYFGLDGIRHGSGRASWFYAACTLSWTTVAVLSMWSALGRGAAASWRSRSILVGTALGTPAILLAIMCGLAALGPTLRAGAEPIGFWCLDLTLAAAAFPLLALLHVRRGSDPVHPAFTGAALGSACGASAGVMVELWCPVANPSHIAVGHVLPIVVLMLAGAILGARSLGVRRH